MKVRKKPVEVEAFLFDYAAYETMPELYPMVESIPTGYKEQTEPVIDTLEGFMLISDGDYIIKGVKGEFYPCKPDIFDLTYDIVDL